MATGINNLPNPGMSFTPFDILTAAELNQMVANIQSLATGSGIGDGSINTVAIADAAVSGSKISATAITLGYAQRATDFSATSGTPVQITGLTSSVTIPSGGRRVEVIAYASNAYQAGSGGAFEISIWEGAVNTGTQLNKARMNNVTGGPSLVNVIASYIPTAGSKTYNVAVKSGSGQSTIEAGATFPMFILVKLV